MQTYMTSFRAMGSQFNIWLETNHDGAAILRSVPGQIEQMETALSRFRPGSELSHLNRQIGEWVRVSECLFTVIQAAKIAAQQTSGLYNPLILNALLAAGYDRSFEYLNVLDSELMEVKVPAWEDIQLDSSRQGVYLPAPIDLSGIGKGWAGAYLAAELAAFGACLVDAGGALFASDQPSNSAGWAVQVHDPLNAGTPLLTLRLKDQAVATSGIDYRRWGINRHHLIDPRTGKPAKTDVISATVIHPDMILAEAYAKAIVLQGSETGLSWFAEQIVDNQQVSAGIVICRDSKVLATQNFKQFIQ